METNFTAKVTYSSREMSVREKIAMKNFADAKKLDDEVTHDNKLTLEVKDYVIVTVHNEASANPDYDVYLFITTDGEKYMTSSDSTRRQIADFIQELEEAGEAPFPMKLEFYKMPSKNYPGRSFITCNLI